MGLDLPEPVFHGVEWLQIIDRVGHNDAHGSFVVRLGNGLEALLTSRVPDLHADFFTVDFQCLDFEINAYRDNDEEIPMVVRWDVMKLFSQNLRRMLVLPTPLSPMMSSFAR